MLILLDKIDFVIQRINWKLKKKFDPLLACVALDQMVMNKRLKKNNANVVNKNRAYIIW